MFQNFRFISVMLYFKKNSRPPVSFPFRALSVSDNMISIAQIKKSCQHLFYLFRDAARTGGRHAGRNAKPGSGTPCPPFPASPSALRKRRVPAGFANPARMAPWRSFRVVRKRILWTEARPGAGLPAFRGCFYGILIYYKYIYKYIFMASLFYHPS